MNSPVSATLDDELLTVAEAAKLLKVNASTVWRWINQGELPAYRVGQRRIRLKRADLARLIRPARNPEQERATVADQERERLSRPLTEAERQQALAALKAAERLRAEMLAQRGGKPFSDSAEILNELRDQRSRDLE